MYYFIVLHVFTNIISIFKILYRYNRQHNQVPGKLSLNIRGIPNNIGKNYTKKLYSFISFLVVKSEYLQITIEAMNNMDMIPR